MIHHLLVPPSFTWKPANQTVMEGTKAAFHCNATGNPTPKISWMKDGNAVAKGNSLSLETNRNNSGNYWCLAENGVGETINTTTYLDVQCKFDKETDEVTRCVKSFTTIVSKPVVDPGGSWGGGGFRNTFLPPYQTFGIFTTCRTSNSKIVAKTVQHTTTLYEVFKFTCI